ncbi:hypothetical protein [Gracilimonas mengyeensis]|uniref:Uncharacterized protein n=1 Tax=Gracilimonas mengyeensis TaxID=1302730 RepID=A0A521E426_9BACT|nr:hypothetical protein [Gracilimonas mengyeensis]SMO77920.1 hypothetical protein SAMN06265219_11081 [Gracilimonas mengyeensis]
MNKSKWIMLFIPAMLLTVTYNFTVQGRIVAQNIFDKEKVVYMGYEFESRADSGAINMLLPIMEIMDIEIEELEEVILDYDNKSECNIQIKGTSEGKEFDLTTTIGDISCMEMKKIKEEQ